MNNEKIKLHKLNSVWVDDYYFAVLCTVNLPFFLQFTLWINAVAASQPALPDCFQFIDSSLLESLQLNVCLPLLLAVIAQS